MSEQVKALVCESCGFVVDGRRHSDICKVPGPYALTTLVPLDLITPLVEALEYYAKHARYEGENWHGVIVDSGECARFALAALPELKAQEQKT